MVILEGAQVVLKSWDKTGDLICDSCNKMIVGDYNLVSHTNGSSTFEVFHLTPMDCAYADAPIKISRRRNKGHGNL